MTTKSTNKRGVLMQRYLERVIAADGKQVHLSSTRARDMVAAKRTVQLKQSRLLNAAKYRGVVITTKITTTASGINLAARLVSRPAPPVSSVVSVTAALTPLPKLAPSLPPAQLDTPEQRIIRALSQEVFALDLTKPAGLSRAASLLEGAALALRALA